MKIHKDNEDYNWFVAHHGTDDINPNKILRCDFCLKVMGKFELTDYEVSGGFMCNECVKLNEQY